MDWAFGSGVINLWQRDTGMFHFVIKKPQPPAIGTLSIQLKANDPPGNQITTQIQVIP